MHNVRAFVVHELRDQNADMIKTLAHARMYSTVHVRTSHICTRTVSTYMHAPVNILC